MLSDVATFEVYASGLAVMPEAASISAAPRVTVAHAAPEVAPLPQYWKLPEAAVATNVNVPLVLSVRVPPLTLPAATLTPEILTSLAIRPLPGSNTESVLPLITAL